MYVPDKKALAVFESTDLLDEAIDADLLGKLFALTAASRIFDGAVAACVRDHPGLEQYRRDMMFIFAKGLHVGLALNRQQMVGAPIPDGQYRKGDAINIELKPLNTNG